MSDDVGSTPQFEAPTLAALSRQIFERPVWMMRDAKPLAVDPETYKKAFEEMKVVLGKQGRPVLAAAWADMPNFLLRGIPVVMNG